MAVAAFRYTEWSMAAKQAHRKAHEWQEIATAAWTCDLVGLLLGIYPGIIDDARCAKHLLFFKYMTVRILYPFSYVNIK